MGVAKSNRRIMSKIICIQAGHYPRTTGATGAPGEQELNWRITTRLDDLLIARGFVVQIVGADPKDAEISKNYDLFIALHGEADVHNMDGGMISPPDPSVDQVYKESKRISDAIGSLYFKESGIVERPEWISNGMRFYYMWKRLSAKTPCVILEMGVVQNAHDKVILADTDRVAIAIAKGICKAFGVDYEPAPQPPAPPTPPVDPCEVQNGKIARAKSAITSAKDQINKALAQYKEDCQKALEAYNKAVADEIEKVRKALQ